MRNGLDTEALAMLRGDERHEAEKMLILCLPDTRGIIGLGAIRSRGAESELVSLFEDQNLDGGNKLIYLATALWQIRPNPRWLAPVIEAMSSSSDPIRRQTAAEMLNKFYHPAAVRALVKALDDSDRLVRYHAARGLLSLHALPVESTDPAHMTIQMLSGDVKIRQKAKQDLVACFAELPISAQSQTHASDE